MLESSRRPETDPRLQRLSDTDILLNFAAALGSLYPYMRAVSAHCYDPYDEVVESLFRALVLGGFSAQYGVAVPTEQCHMYEGDRTSYAAVHRVGVVPKRLPLAVLVSGEPLSLSEAELAGRDLVFLNFGDGLHSLTSPESENDPYDLSFHLTRFTIVDVSSRSPEAEQSRLWVPNSDVTYEFVEAA